MASGFYDMKMKPLMAGAIFGASLTAAGVYHPSVIIGQMRLQDFHMLKVFLTATATSAAVIPLAKGLKFSQTKPNPPCTMEFFHQYDANIIGGAMLGVAMTLTGACPGTVLPQIVTGVRSGLFIGIGGILGALLFAWYTEETDNTGEESTVPTLVNSYGLSEPLAILGYQAVCAAVVAGAMHFAPGDNSLVPPILGGLLIGGSQAASLVLAGRSLGVSAAYEAAARWIMKTLWVEDHGSKPTKSVPFVFGAMLGSWVLSQLAVLPSQPEVTISAARGLIGGAMMIFGARVAQGCTSGHGITGMAQLSIASFISVASMFGGGMALGAVLK